MVFTDGTRSNAGEIAARARFRHRDGQNRFAFYARRQEARLLSVRAELRNIWRDKSGLEVDVEPYFPATDVFLIEYLFIAKVLNPSAAVALVRRHYQVSSCADFKVCLAVDVTLSSPPLGVGCDFSFYESA